jgi:GNAT superfamily N-acetyltransferase
MSATVSQLQQQEVEAVAALWRAYMVELFGQPGHMTAEVFRRDGLGARFNTMVARDLNGAPTAAAVWWMTYDAHHGVQGGEIADMFVARPHRALGVAVQVIAAVAAAVRERGGVFLRGPATPENAQRLARRGYMSSAFPLVNVYWGLGLFDTLADNAGADARTLARCLAAAASAQPSAP